mgnify:CR=1 FL=1
MSNLCKCGRYCTGERLICTTCAQIKSLQAQLATKDAPMSDRLEEIKGRYYREWLDADLKGLALPPDHDEKRWLISQVESLEAELALEKQGREDQSAIGDERIRGLEKQLAAADPYKHLWAVVEQLGLGAGGCPDSLILECVSDLKEQLTIKEAVICGMREALEMSAPVWYKVEEIKEWMDGEGMRGIIHIAPWVTEHLQKALEKGWSMLRNRVAAFFPTCPHKEFWDVAREEREQVFVRLEECQAQLAASKEEVERLEKLRRQDTETMRHLEAVIERLQAEIETLNGRIDRLTDKRVGGVIQQLGQAMKLAEHETSLVGMAPMICSGCGGEINPDYGKCRRCG